MKMVEPNEPVIEKKVKKEKVADKTPNSNYWPVKDLPSKYKLYPAGTVIEARPLKVLEVKMLSSMNDNNANFVINDVLRKTTRGLPIEELIIADKLFLIFWLRANTYTNSGFSLTYNCMNCDTEDKYEFSLDKLEINDLKDDYSTDKPITLPISGDIIRIDQLRVKDENNVSEFIKRNKRSNINWEIDILNISNLIVMINEESVTNMYNTYNYLLGLDPNDYAYIESYIKHYDIGINPTMDITCNKCGGITPVGVSFRSEFFIPTYKF